MKSLKVAYAQMNFTVGDIDNNLSKSFDTALGLTGSVDLVAFSECSGSGYPLQDLSLAPNFVRDFRTALQNISNRMVLNPAMPAILVGGPEEATNLPHNSMYLLDTDGTIKVTRKHHLANQDVYDEVRTFSSGPLPTPFVFRGWKIGVPICEDLWHGDVIRNLVEEGSDIIICPNGSHFYLGKQDVRRNIVKTLSGKHQIPLAYINQIGGQDELVFDGGSMIADHNGHILFETAFVQTVFAVKYMHDTNGKVTTQILKDIGTPHDAYWDGYPREPMQVLYRSLVMGVRDYVGKNNFKGVVIGMSGGIDSALSAAVAVDALGADQVLLVRLPSKFTSDESMRLADDAAKLLGCRMITIPIVDTVNSLESALLSVQVDNKPFINLQGTTAENLQARSRAVILMAISNATGYLLLSTGNKSEMSVGYCTLYADMCGGYNALKDTWKTDVFALSRWRNANTCSEFLHVPQSGNKLLIPVAIIDRSPSAELAPDQTDENTLGLYTHLDPVLKCLIEERMSAAQAAHYASLIVGEEITLKYALKCARLIHLAEHKRRQAPPGVVAGRSDFSKGWRLPITNNYGV